MSQEPKIRANEQWRPSTTYQVLQRRAQLLSDIRHFFAVAGVMEVETGVLATVGATDVNIQPICAMVKQSTGLQTCYLQTSPEYAMKRLLAAGCGPIYQICKAFRNEEQGRLHHPEFTMLEWYRPGFTHHQLMHEVCELLQKVAGFQPAKKVSYQALFEAHLRFNPHQMTLTALKAELCNHHIDVQSSMTLTINDCLELLFSTCIEDKLTGPSPWFVYDYPCSMAALAKIRQGLPPVAERFEVYYKGLELANGYHELTIAKEQRKRFQADLAKREKLGLQPIPIDEHLLQAMEYGLPACAGVALGIDRLLMAMLGSQTIEAVIPFTLD